MQFQGRERIRQLLREPAVFRIRGPQEVEIRYVGRAAVNEVTLWRSEGSSVSVFMSLYLLESFLTHSLVLCLVAVVVSGGNRFFLVSSIPQCF